MIGICQLKKVIFDLISLVSSRYPYQLTASSSSSSSSESTVYALKNGSEMIFFSHPQPQLVTCISDSTIIQSYDICIYFINRRLTSFGAEDKKRIRMESSPYSNSTRVLV